MYELQLGGNGNRNIGNRAHILYERATQLSGPINVVLRRIKLSKMTKDYENRRSKIGAWNCEKNVWYQKGSYILILKKGSYI